MSLLYDLIPEKITKLLERTEEDLKDLDWLMFQKMFGVSLNISNEMVLRYHQILKNDVQFF